MLQRYMAFGLRYPSFQSREMLFALFNAFQPFSLRGKGDWRIQGILEFVVVEAFGNSCRQRLKWLNSSH